MLTMELVKVTFKLSFSVRIHKKRPCVGNLNLWGSSFNGKNKIKMFFTFAEANYYYYFFEVAQSCLTLCNPMDCSPPDSSIHGIFQARVLEWVAIFFSRTSSRPRAWTLVSRIVGRRFTVWTTRAPLKDYVLQKWEKWMKKKKAKVIRLNLSKATGACHYLQGAAWQFEKMWREILCAFNWVESLSRQGAHSRCSFRAEWTRRGRAAPLCWLAIFSPLACS